MYDIIFTDINMPELNGFQLSRIINGMIQNNSSVINCTIFGLSGDTTEEMNAEAKSSGITQILKKPFGKNDLVKCLTEYLCK